MSHCPRSHICALAAECDHLMEISTAFGITRPGLEPIATAATPPTAETAPLPPARHHKNINSRAASRLHPTE
jgi:hypothetical protein